MNSGRKQFGGSLAQGLGLVLALGIGTLVASAAGTDARAQTSSMAAADTVGVVLTDNALQAPDTLQAGTVAFSINNQGSKAHGFAVEASGAESAATMLEAPVAPGTTATLSVELEAGSYLLYALTDGERDSKLSKTVTVVAKKMGM
jgi:uncharacterized cupredoxin-like copper-binding protein